MKCALFSIGCLIAILGFSPLPTLAADRQVQQGQDAKGAKEPDANVPRWFVYRDATSEDNHGHWTNIMPAEGADMMKLQLNDKTHPAFGKTSLRITTEFLPPNWCGIAVACKPDYWGIKKNEPAYDLSKATKLVFYARGDKGGETIQVKVGIAGDKPFGDSAKVASATRWIALKKTWERYELPINQTRTNLQRTIIPFTLVTSQIQNEDSEITIWLDQIYYVTGK